MAFQYGLVSNDVRKARRPFGEGEDDSKLSLSVRRPGRHFSSSKALRFYALTAF